jgi:hypothetical protein
VISDPAAPIEPALDVGLAADEDTVAYLERLWVLEAHSGLDAQAGPAAPGECQPEDATHRRVERTVPMDESAIELDQALPAVPRR